MSIAGIDLFAGAGGMSLGAHMSGVATKLVIEADRHALNTYKVNLGANDPLYHEGDIRTFNKVKLKTGREPLVVFGGPPCQGFSTSNQRTRSSDNPNNWLFEEFIRCANLYSPEWIVFENVKGIKETEGGMFLDYILQSFHSKGYTSAVSVLNASNFGVPQRRERLFIVASRSGINFQFPEPSEEIVTVADAFGDLQSLSNGANICTLPYQKKAIHNYARSMRGSRKSCSNNLVTKNAPYILDRYKHIPPGGNWESIPACLMKNYKDSSRCHTGIYRRLELGKPSVVIGNYRKNMLIHPSENRGLSVREAARLQSFPDSFVFQGSIGFQQQQVGNAVPPLLAKAIFSKLLSY